MLIHTPPADELQFQQTQPLSRNSSVSREGTPFESVPDLEVLDVGRENPANTALLSVSVTQLTAESLTQQVNQLRRTLINGSMVSSQDVGQSLVQAYLAAKQVCSYLNIAYTALQSEKIKGSDSSTALQTITMHKKSSSFTVDSGNARQGTTSPSQFQTISPIHHSRSVDMLQPTMTHSLPLQHTSPTISPVPPPRTPRPQKFIEQESSSIFQSGWWHQTTFQFSPQEESKEMRRSMSIDDLQVFNPWEEYQGEIAFHPIRPHFLQD